MITRRILLAATCLALAGPAMAQSAWPDRPVTIVVPFSPGGATDITARLVADTMSDRFGQPFVVENRTGAAGNIGVEAVVNAEPDGYTFLFATQGTMTVNPHIYDLPYDPLTDLTPVSQTFSVDHFVAVLPSLGVSDLAGFIAMAKEKPGELSYGSAGVGSFLHLTTVMLEEGAGIELNHVPYDGSAAARTDLLAGNIDMVMDSVPSALGQIESGSVLALAITGGTRNSAVPDVPTMAEAGVDGYAISSWGGLMAPKGTDPEIVETLSNAVQEAYATDAIQAAFAELGLGAASSSPDGFAELVQSDYTTLGKVIESAGIERN
ncbi:tripartite tricarboxylate transporter substrate binding protein [Silicimonas algicola]|uniref:Tripartite-type tricarboxylate transporter receptor subunit TctC n=1 Tax=Silicimonas algicola TaxID=1826607 RepID=A0A316FWE0_9RHOB|nr:tripartite tricarboxylate transporter substrate binding protein [Silicimonas algicola]AZQ68303.1 tripartite tricarboxylate transporter substrate binding protein [Silicimonas algicola]PWK52723.1 tripartite-type tricarboxylate transporter receptor subunit TctC [Silicimonas algicola]